MNKRTLPFIDYELVLELIRALRRLDTDAKDTAIVKGFKTNPRNPSIYYERPS